MHGERTKMCVFFVYLSEGQKKIDFELQAVSNLRFLRNEPQNWYLAEMSLGELLGAGTMYLGASYILHLYF